MVAKLFRVVAHAVKSPMVDSIDILDENMTDSNKSRHFLNGLFAIASLKIVLYFTTDMTMGTWAPTCSFKLTILDSCSNVFFSSFVVYYILFFYFLGVDLSGIGYSLQDVGLCYVLLHYFSRNA